MSTPKNYDKPNVPDQGGEEGKPAPAHHAKARANDPDNPAKIQQETAEAGGPIPRVIKPNERSPGSEYVRFKVACRNYTDVGPFPTSYILCKAGDKAEDDARECYLKDSGLTAKIEQIVKNQTAAMRTAWNLAGKKGDPEVVTPVPPELSVKRLED